MCMALLQKETYIVGLFTGSSKVDTCMRREVQVYLGQYSCTSKGSAAIPHFYRLVERGVMSRDAIYICIYIYIYIYIYIAALPF